MTADPARPVTTTPARATHPAATALRVLALLAGLAGVAATVALNVAQSEWDRSNPMRGDPADAFVNGSIGTELAPLVAFEVLPAIFPEEFHPVDAYLKAGGAAGATGGDWVEQYGFIDRPPAPAPVDKGNPLPVGFTLSYHRPDSGAPSPIPFVGLSCAACHSAEVRTEADRPGKVLYGVGNPALNLLAFSEAVRAVVLKRADPNDPKSDYVLTPARIRDEHAKQGRELTAAERVLTWGWLNAVRGEARNSVAEYQRVIDEPYAAAELMDPRFMLAGPIRTQPFRSLVRVHLDRPGWWSRGHQMDQGFSKIPVVFHQAHEYHGEWAQFDGSVRNIVARSTLAASTAGANVNNLSRPDIANNIIRAAEYTERLAPPAWADVFGDRDGFRIDRAAAASGKQVYHAECYRCHGGPDGQGGWTWDRSLGPEVTLKFGEIIPLSVIGTDPQRVQFRHKTVIPGVVADKFGEGFRKRHPLAFAQDDLRAPDGYYAGPIGGAFLRAPYLHNASVLTLAELIGLEPRRDLFYRGRNVYDPVRVGWRSPAVPEGLRRNADGTTEPRPLDRQHYFLFDTKVRGNSNAGHAYPPWAFNGGKLAERQTEQLRALLEYLKTI